MSKRTNLKTWLVMSTFFLAVLVMCRSVQAEPIDVNNYSFEYFEDGSQIMCHMAQTYEAANRYFKGNIDDVRIYDRTLSPAEIAGLAGTDPNVVVNPNNLVGWWKFDDGSGSTAENSGSFASSHDGNLMPACPNCPVWTSDAHDGNALAFDGSDDYVSIPALNLDSNTVTITAWIKRDGNQPIYAGIVFSRDGNTTAGLSFGSTGPGGNPPWTVNNELAYNWDDPCAWDFHSGLIIPVNQWVFVAVVVEPNKATLYLSDGVTVDSNTNVLDHNKEEFDGITRIGSDHVHVGPFLELMGWMSEGGFVGADVDCNAPGVCENCRSPAAPDGNVYSYMQSNNTYLYQILEHNIVGGRRYILAFDALAWNTSLEIIPSFFYDDPCLGHIALASQTINLSDPNEWMYDQMVDFVAQAGQDYIGEKLGIKFNAPIPGDLNTWRWIDIDNVRVDVSTAAHSPNPADGAIGVAEDAVLSWGPGFFAADVNGHDVYLGTDFNDVNNRDISIYKGRQDANSYEPPGELEIGQTYYWAIDEANASHPNSPWPGPVWTFSIRNIYYVDVNATGTNDGSSWDDAFIDLQDALTAAQGGDDIWVAQGTYTPSQLTDPNDLRTATFELADGVAIYGGFAGSETDLSQRDWETYETILSGDLDGNDVEVLDPCDLLTEPTRAENSYHVVTGNDTGPNAILDGFTITGGNANGAYAAGQGGGIYCGYSSPTLTNCTFSNNSAAGYGGGMYSSSNPTVTNCTFSNNSASHGSGIYNYGNGSPTVTNCLFRRNSASSHGGGMHNVDSNAVVTRCTFYENSATDTGGGMYNWNSSLMITNCTFSGNSAGSGGGMHNDEGSNVVVTGCTFSGNSATINGGGMTLEYSITKLANCTFSGNDANTGGGIAKRGAPPPVTYLTNCILWGNTAYYGSKQAQQIFLGPGTYIDYSCVEGWTGGFGGTGNIGDDPNDDPNFVREPNDGGDGWGVGDNDDFGDLRLLAGSACIDAGDNDLVPADIADLDGDGDTDEPTSRDLHGHLRFIDEPNTIDTGNGTGPIVDMGAYEYILRIYVDDDAASDPGPGNPNVSDPNEDGSRGHPFDAVQEAIDAAVDDDTIVVLQGTYTGTGNRDIDFSGKAITIRSTDPNDPNVVASTIIDPNGTDVDPHRGFVFQSGEDANSVLNGLTITNGYGPSELTEVGPNSVGGAIFIYDSSPTVTNCTFSNNWAEDGGGMCNANNSSPTVTNCTFSGNSASAAGGGMYNNGSSPTVTNCTFIGNLSTYDGGGMCNDEYSSPTVTDCTFIGNSTEDGGGLSNYYFSSPTVINCTFLGNMADEGGGIYSYEGNLTLTNCTFIGNSASRNGGGMYHQNSSPVLTNCTFVANSAQNGNALACDSPHHVSPSNLQVTNCIFCDTGDEIWNNDNSAITVTYSNVQGGWSGTGNIDLNPVLTPDGHLHSSSPCINLGDPNFVLDPNAPTDIDGEPRIMNGRVEIGADEFADSDDDGLPNWWEQDYFRAPNVADANADPDGDGIINRDEYELYSSNPNAPPLYVPAGFYTIQAAIDAASDGDTVLVAAGTYKGIGNKDLDFGGKSIILRAPDGPNNTIIDCENSGRGFNFHSSETPASAVIGFTITNGRADNGGAILFLHSHPQIRECVITGNIATIQGGGIYSSLSIPTLADCNISDNNAPNIADIWMEYGGAWIVGTVRIADSNWVGNDITLTGDGTLQMYAGAALNLAQSQILCNLAGPVTMQVDVESKLVIEGDSIIDLYNPADPNNNGVIECDGLLGVKDKAKIINANINITRASFEDNANVTNCKIHVSSNAPYGQFFIDANASFTYNDIYADGDRYMHLDPSIFSGPFVHNRIFVTINESVGLAGELFELRGDPNFADPCCDPNEFMCQMAPGTIPDCNLATWTIERLELAEKAKLNFTNRFGFQPPYDPGSDYDVLYVKELVLGANSVLNTSYNWFYYETLVGDLNSVIDIPLLGFSLINIALDNDLEFKHRVTHNNFIDLKPDPFDYTRIHVKRLEGYEPDPNGMMQMRNLLDLDPSSSRYQEVVNAQAKGLFAKASEDEDITIEFEYVFTADPYGDAELVVYLSDKPGLGDNLVEVARVKAPALGRPGSVGSNKFAIFSGSFPRGSLNFIRGTYIELKLLGSANASCLINNWDPRVNCTGICGDFNIEMPIPLNIVDIYDYLVLLAEFGLSGPSGIGKGCLDLVKDGCVNNDDLLAWGIDELLNACGGGASPSSTSATGEAFENQGIGESEPLLICGKPASGVGNEVPSSYLYSVNTSGVCTSDPNETNNGGRLVTDSDGNIYQIDGYLGLISLETQTPVIEPNVIDDGNNLVLIGFDEGKGFLLSDVAFKPGEPNIVYVVPVQVDPQDGNCPYMAAAKLQLTGGGNYNLLQLYGKNPATDPCQNNTLVDCTGDLVYEPDVQHLHEIEVDSEGNLFVLSSHLFNDNNWLLVYDEEIGNNSEVRLSLSDTNIVGPTAMVVSSFSDKLYLASSAKGPNDLTTEVYRFSIDKATPGEPNLIFDDIVEINCPEPNVCSSYPSMCDAELGYISMITSMIENPGDGTLYVTGFTAPKFPADAVMSSWPYNQPGGIFTTPMFAEVAADATEMIEAVNIINSDLVLPFSMVWTVPAEKCGGADLNDSNDVDFADLAILASQWLQPPGSPSADIAPEVPDGFVDILDLAVLAGHWLETGCLD